MSTYSDVESAPTNREPFMTIIRWTTLITLTLAVSLASADLQSYLSGVPDYYWYYGCSPTSGGELIGYWDNQPGYGNLYHGTAPMYAGSGYQAIDEMISSTEHNAATFNGAECTHDNSPPAGDTGPNSVACFMHTDPSDGDSYEWNIATGMRRYAAYDDPDTSTNESMDFHSFVYYAPYAGWSSTWNAAAFTFEDLMYEVDAGHPMMLNLSLDGGGSVMTAAAGLRCATPGRTVSATAPMVWRPSATAVRSGGGGRRTRPANSSGTPTTWMTRSSSCRTTAVP